MSRWDRARAGALLAASWGLVRRSALPALATLTAILVASGYPVLDDGYGMPVLRGTGVLLACAWVLAVDDPGGEVLAATPYPRHVRTSARVVAGLLVLVPVWAGAAVAVELQAPAVPVLAVGAEGLALGVLGVAVAAGFRAWQDRHRPSHLTLVTVVVVALLADWLPRWYALNQDQTWGPPWEAAHIRWLAVLLTAGGVLGLALADPLHRRAARHGSPV